MNEGLSFSEVKIGDKITTSGNIPIDVIDKDLSSVTLKMFNRRELSLNPDSKGIMQRKFDIEEFNAVNFKPFKEEPCQ